MNLCVSDIPIGADMKFTMPGGREVLGRVVHNYGAGIVLMTTEGIMMEINGQVAEQIEAVDRESSASWRQSISRSQAEHRQFMEKLAEVMKG